MVRGEACRRAPGHADRTHPPPWPPSTCSAVRGVDRDPRAPRTLAQSACLISPGSLVSPVPRRGPSAR